MFAIFLYSMYFEYEHMGYNFYQKHHDFPANQSNLCLCIIYSMVYNYTVKIYRHSYHSYFVMFCVLFVFWGTRIDENGVPGPIRDQVGIQTPKKTQKVSGFCLDLSSLGVLFRLGVPLG